MPDFGRDVLLETLQCVSPSDTKITCCGGCITCRRRTSTSWERGLSSTVWTRAKQRPQDPARRVSRWNDSKLLPAMTRTSSCCCRGHNRHQCRRTVAHPGGAAWCRSLMHDPWLCGGFLVIILDLNRAVCHKLIARVSRIHQAEHVVCDGGKVRVHPSQVP
jgi:hypothetical protein